MLWIASIEIQLCQSIASNCDASITRRQEKSLQIILNIKQKIGTTHSFSTFQALLCPLSKKYVQTEAIKNTPVLFVKVIELLEAVDQM